MSCYADTGFLVSLHGSDANTAAAKSWLQLHGSPMVWTWLHEMEFRNAVRLQVFRKQINRRDSKLILHNQALGLETGVYLSSNPAGAEVCREVERLSNLYTSSLGTRTLDLLHVAQAIVLGVPQFLTFDVRQASAARATGLDTPELLR